MKSELKENNKQNEEIKFPVLMKNHNGEFIVLFTDLRSGTVVWVNSQNIYDIGYHSFCWSNCIDSNKWKKVDGEVTLRN